MNFFFFYRITLSLLPSWLQSHSPLSPSLASSQLTVFSPPPPPLNCCCPQQWSAPTALSTLDLFWKVVSTCCALHTESDKSSSHTMNHSLENVDIAQWTHFILRIPLFKKSSSHDKHVLYWIILVKNSSSHKEHAFYTESLASKSRPHTKNTPFTLNHSLHKSPTGNEHNFYTESFSS